MICYDCSTTGTTVQAVGTCVACGAAVCADCAEIGTRTIRVTEGFVSADVSAVETRVLNCRTCAHAAAVHHPVHRGLVPR